MECIIKNNSWKSALIIIIFMLAGCSWRSPVFSIFNGKNLKGWEVKHGPADIWSVKDGVIVCESHGESGWIGTKETYRNFIFM